MPPKVRSFLPPIANILKILYFLMSFSRCYLIILVVNELVSQLYIRVVIEVGLPCNTCC